MSIAIRAWQGWQEVPTLLWVGTFMEVTSEMASLWEGTYILGGSTAYDRNYQNGKIHRTGLKVTHSGICITVEWRDGVLVGQWVILN